LEWLENPELRRFLVISKSLWERLQDDEAGEQFAPFGVIPDPQSIERVRLALAPVERFSSDQSSIPDGTRAIRDALLSSNEPLADVLADEWVFVTSQSIAVIRAAAKRSLEAFKRAGAKVYNVSDDVMARGLEQIQHRLPPGLLGGMKVVGTFPGDDIGRILMFGGTIAIFIVPAIGLPAAIIGSIQQGVAVVAGDP
jgi:hypothetical protein